MNCNDIDWLIFLLGASPMLLLCAAVLRREVYEKRHGRSTDHSTTPLPFLVKLHKRTMVGLWTFAIYLFPVIPLFGVPYLIYHILCPERLNTLNIYYVLGTALVYILIICQYVCSAPIYENQPEQEQAEQSEPDRASGV